MKIAYLHHGISIHDQKFLQYLSEKEEYDIHLISFYDGEIPHIKNITLHQYELPRPKYSYPLGMLLSKRIIRKIKPDVVHGNYLTTYGFYASFSNFHPIFQMVWGSDILIASKHKLEGMIAKYSLSKADLASVDCEIGKEEMIKMGCPEGKIIVFPWGIDINKFNPYIHGSNIREKLGWEDKLIVTCTRSHSSVYGIEYLLFAIPEIVKKEDATRFLLIGSGPLTEKLKQMVRDLRIEKYVKFTGMIPNEDLPKYLATSDLYVSSSLSDGTSVSLLEAMACGLPVVVTDVDAILEWITDGENGLVVPKKNPDVLAKAICMLLEDDNLREKFGRRNYKIAEERASWDDNVKVLEDIYQSLAKR